MEGGERGTRARPLIVLVDMDNTITHFNERGTSHHFINIYLLFELINKY
jgi:hypothetical protein